MLLKKWAGLALRNEIQISLMTRPRRGWLTPVFGLAALVFACVAAWLGWRARQDTVQIRVLQAQLTAARAHSHELVAAWDTTNELLGAPGTIRVALAQQPGGPEGRAGVLYNARLGSLAYTGELAPAPADRSYQLWLVPARGAPVSLGIFSGEQPTTILTAKIAPGLAAKAFAVTLEPKGGSQGSTGPKVLVGAPG